MEDINTLIDNWHICPYSDDVDEFFACFTTCTEMYLKHYSLSMETIVNIISDLRDLLNPDENQNLFYFTDIICDSILLEHKGLEYKDFSSFCEYVESCKDRVYLKL